MINLGAIRNTLAGWIIKPLLPVLMRSRLTPNSLTLIGLLINGIAACVIATKHFLLGGFLILFSGLLDLLDGTLARLTRKTTSFGAFLDSTADRISEAVLFLGLLVVFLKEPLALAVLLIFLAMIGSFLISYIRARAEGLGVECQVGLFSRAERVIVLALGLIFNQVLIALAILVGLSFLTVGQRLVHVWQQANKIGQI